jgi:transposase
MCVSRVKIRGRAVIPLIPAERKTRIALSVVAGEMTIAEAARREKVGEQSIGRWKADFPEASKTAPAAGRSRPSTREQQLDAEVADLTRALGEAAVGLRVWKRSRGGPAVPFMEELPIQFEDDHPGAVRPLWRWCLFGFTWIRRVRAGRVRPSARHALPAKRNPQGRARCGGRPR